MAKRIRPQIARGSAELAILSLLAEQPLYGFEISKRIDEKSGGALRFTLASLYPMLYGLEKRGWIEGRWEANRARPPLLRPHPRRQKAAGASAPRMGHLFPGAGPPGRSQPCLIGALGSASAWVLSICRG